MTSTREVMALCGDTLDRASEEKYRDLRAALKTFINENIKGEDRKIGPDYDQTKRSRAQRLIAEGHCKSPAYNDWNDWLQSVFQDEATIRKRLEIPDDPWNGDCL